MKLAISLRRGDARLKVRCVLVPSHVPATPVPSKAPSARSGGPQSYPLVTARTRKRDASWSGEGRHRRTADPGQPGALEGIPTSILGTGTFRPATSRPYPARSFIYLTLNAVSNYTSTPPRLVLGNNYSPIAHLQTARVGLKPGTSEPRLLRWRGAQPASRAGIEVSHQSFRWRVRRTRTRTKPRAQVIICEI